MEPATRQKCGQVAGWFARSGNCEIAGGAECGCGDGGVREREGSETFASCGGREEWGGEEEKEAAGHVDDDSSMKCGERKAALFVPASQVGAQNLPIRAAVSGQTVDDLALDLVVRSLGPNSFEVHRA
jgi:hypothetical protein